MKSAWKIVFRCAFVAALWLSPCDAFSESPMYYWEYREPVTLGGRKFYGSWAKNGNAHSFADSYREQEGFVPVRGYGELLFYLYDTITYHGGDKSMIYEKVIPGWVKDMGYAIDFDKSHLDVRFHPSMSIKKLMNQRACDMAVVIFSNRNGEEYVQIIDRTSRGKYKVSSYYLVK